MANTGVTFSHPLVDKLMGSLTVSVNPDFVQWSYGLNTQSYPTYGGEVIQILSVFFGDMNVSGTVRTYAELERIYGWFIAYMQYATQGRDNPSYDQRPVAFYYNERQWQFAIWPKSLPAFKYGRDVVAPTWTLTAAVKEPDATMAQQIQSYEAYNASKTGKFAPFGVATGNFGNTGDLTDNPWASPDGALKKGQTLNSFLAEETAQMVDTFSSFVSDFTDGSLDKLPQFQQASLPPGFAAKASKQNTAKKGKA